VDGGSSEEEAHRAARASVSRELLLLRPIKITFALKEQLRALVRAKKGAVEEGLLTPEEADKLIPVR
jgi:hypothetical protein